MSFSKTDHSIRTFFSSSHLIKIIIPALTLFILYYLIVMGIFLPLLKKVYVHEKKEMIKRIVEVVVYQLNNRDSDIRHNHLDVEKEKKIVLKRMENLRFGKEKKDYFWIIGPDRKVIMHPYMKEIVNVDPMLIKAPDGHSLASIVQKMTSVTQYNQSGFVEYEWQYKDQAKKLSKKLSYVYKFEPWNWIIGVGIYIDDINRELMIWRYWLLLIGFLLALITITLYIFMFYRYDKAYQRELVTLTKLKEQQEIFRILFEESADPTFLMEKRTITDCNEAACRLFGFENKNGLIGKSPLDISPAYQFDMISSEVLANQKFIEADEKGFTRFEWIHHTSNGSLIPMDINMTKMVMQSKEIFYIVLRDITEQKHVQDALRENEHRFRTTLFAIGDAVVSTDLRGNILQMNPAAEKLLNCLLTQAYNQNISKVLKLYNENDELLIHLEMSSAEIINSLQKSREVRLISTTGDTYRVSVTANMIRSDKLQNEGLVLVIRDITREYQLNIEIEKRERLFRTIFETSPIAISINELSTGEYLTINPAFSELSGFAESELIGTGMTLSSFIKNFPNIQQTLKELKINDKLNNIQTKVINKNQEELDIYFSSALIDYNNEPCLLSITVDLTEVKKLEDQLRQAQKMDVIGQLAGGIAHDFNNMLGGILGFAELLDIYVSKDPKIREYSQSIIEGAKRAAELTQKLLVFSRKAKTAEEVFDIHDSITTAIALLKRTIDPRIKISTSYKASPSKVKGDQTLLQNAFLNLAVNARDAMPDGGTLTFISRNVYLDDISCQYHYKQLSPGDYLEIQVSDTGVGIPKEYMERIFEPFFTTKPVGKGTGLGLSAVFGTIHQHQGSISVYSEENNGTVFKILLPLYMINSDLEKKNEEDKLVNGSGRILIIEDETLIRNMSREVLVSLGYDVLTAEDGEEGLRVYLEHNQSIDLVLLDIVMPKLSGKDVLIEIRKINPEAKVIMTSGFNQEMGIEDLINQNNIRFIQKPYRISVLSQLIDNMIKV